MRRIRSLRSQGRNREAEEALRWAVRVTSDPGDLVRAWEQLGQTLFDLGENDPAVEAFRCAVDTADGAGLRAGAVELRVFLAGWLTHADHFTEALELVDAGLQVSPRDPALWLRRGKVLWYAHRFSDAHASLTAAEQHGEMRARVLHARGQVLAEWGVFEQAIEELDFVLARGRTPTSAAYARSGRAYALAHIGQFERALVEFTLAEDVTPHNSWLHYLRARCYDDVGDVARAVAGYSIAVAAQAPALNSPKREFALRRMEFYAEQRTS
jgi:tetratricopeptide (TPR) repeat protein